MRRRLRSLASRLRDFINAPVLAHVRENGTTAGIAEQILLKNWYRWLLETNQKLPAFSEIGFTNFSQTDEDGILLYLFSILGEGTKTAVEICAGDGLECNTANLIINHGWHALLLDGDQSLVDRGNSFYRRCRQTYVYPPRFIHSWITRDNVNAILSENGFSGEVDLLSLDLDGVDYWIWEAIEVIRPRVVVLEYQDILGPNRDWTVPYAEDFSAAQHPSTNGMPNFSGASLGAFVKLGRKKNYRLVGINRLGYNAFFVRNDLGQEHIPEISVSECFSHSKVIQGMKERFSTVKDYHWVEV